MEVEARDQKEIVLIALGGLLGQVSHVQVQRGRQEGKHYGLEGEGLHSQTIIAKSGSRYMTSAHRLNLELCLCRNLVLSFFSSVLLIFVIFKSKLTITDDCV